MADMRLPAKAFRSRLKQGEHVLGTFIKTPTSHTVEIIGEVGYDFVILDQEHGPFDRGAIDICCLAARASDMAALVRVSEPTPASILSALDLGASGVLVPHCDSLAKARMIAQASRYRGGTRGFSNTTRAGRFGDATMSEHMDEQDTNIACIAMIEDEAALDEIDAIAAESGVDAFFIGRGDLTASMGGPATMRAVARITEAARVAKMPVMVLVSSTEDAAAMRELGATAYIVSNDQNFLKSAARNARETYGAPTRWRVA
jgi:staphyloferrin B biosynthesis citrate synthase